jgi:hypothetical protein
MGVIMMIYAAVEIIGYVLYSKDKPEKEDMEGTTTLLVPESTTENIEVSKAKIKDVKEKKKKKKKE